MDADIQEQFISTIIKTFAYTQEQANYLFIQLMNCVKNKELISIYRLGDEDNQEIDLAILTASLKVIDLNLSKQFDETEQELNNDQQIDPSHAFKYMTHPVFKENLEKEIVGSKKN